MICQNGRIKNQDGDRRSIDHHTTLEMTKKQTKAIEQPKAAIYQSQTIRTMMVIRNNVVVESHLLVPDDMVIRPSEPPHLIRPTEFFDTNALPEIMKSVTERILKSC